MVNSYVVKFFNYIFPEQVAEFVADVCVWVFDSLDDLLFVFYYAGWCKL